MVYGEAEGASEVGTERTSASSPELERVCKPASLAGCMPE